MKRWEAVEEDAASRRRGAESIVARWGEGEGAWETVGSECSMGVTRRWKVRCGGGQRNGKRFREGGG